MGSRPRMAACSASVSIGSFTIFLIAWEMAVVRETGCPVWWESLNQHPAVHSCYSCLWVSLSQFSCLKQWQTVCGDPFQLHQSVKCTQASSDTSPPPDHNQVLMTLITSVMENHNYYKNGTYLSPQKRVWMWFGANWRGTDGVGGCWVWLVESFSGMRGQALLASNSPIRDQPVTSYLRFYQLPNLFYIRNNDIWPITVVERVLKNKCSLFCPTVTPLGPDTAYIVSIYGVSFRKK